MNPVLQPVDDLLNNQGQKIVLLQSQVQSLQALTPTASYSDLEFLQWSLAPGASANTGSVGSLAIATQSLPTDQCASRRLAPAGAYANAYWYTKFGPQPTFIRYEQGGQFLFPSQLDVAASQAVEFDLQQVIGGVVFNWGFQFDYAEGKFRVWNRSSKQWVDTGTTISRPAPGLWTKCQFIVHRDSQAVYYDQAIVNSQPIPLPQSLSFFAPAIGLADMLNYGFQLDGNKAGTSYEVAVYGQSLKCWSGI